MLRLAADQGSGGRLLLAIHTRLFPATPEFEAGGMQRLSGQGLPGQVSEMVTA